jgi:hypothetical protein
MSVATKFEKFIDNLKIKDREIFSKRYGDITYLLNQDIRDTVSKTDNSLQYGSYGRFTAIEGVSDLDMIYKLPSSIWNEYKDNEGPKRILNRVKKILSKRYSQTDIFVDRCVVCVYFTDETKFDVQPVFVLEKEGYLYPDKDQNMWKETYPDELKKELDKMNKNKNRNLKDLSKMVRAWKDKFEMSKMSGLLIDTLTYNFLKTTSYFDEMSRDFFKYLKNLPEKSKYLTPDGKQYVKVREYFQDDAEDTYDLCLDAIKAENQSNMSDKWRKVYGNSFPKD